MDTHISQLTSLIIAKCLVERNYIADLIYNSTL